MITLFDGRTADYATYKPDSMSDAEYLIRCSREPMARVRNELEKWFSRFPEAEKAQMKSNFLSADDVQHQSAFFELFLHELLLRDGWTLTLHPEIEGTPRRPDFLCSKNNTEVLIEAKCATGTAEAEKKAELRLKTAIETVNRRIKSNKFYLSVTTSGLPSQAISGRVLVGKLTEWLDGLDHEACLQDRKDHKDDVLPHCIYSEHGCRLKFEAAAIEAKEEHHERIIGVYTYGHVGGFIAPELPVRTAIGEKAKAYGNNLPYPYVIAVNTHDNFYKIDRDTLSALYGSEGLRVKNIARGAVETFPSRFSDGAFGHAGHPRKPHVSGAVVFNNINTTGIGASHNGIYVPNVFAANRIAPPISGLYRMDHDGEKFKPVIGKSLTEMLGLPDKWPLHNINEFA